MRDQDLPGETAILLGHDGAPAAQVALHAAIELAQRLRASLHVLHSITLEDYGVDPETAEFDEVRDRNLAAERSVIADSLSGTDVPWTYHEEYGDPAARLARLADEVDAAYIVIGASHRGWLHVGGSVPKRLVRLQPRPVVVVPDPHDIHHH